MFEVRETENKGRGLFATTDIKKGEIIDTAPVVVFDSETTAHFVKVDDGEKVLAWEKETSGKITSCAVALSVMMLCNHAENYNATIDRDTEIDLAQLIALKTICKDEEITLNYTLRKTF